MSSPSNLYAEKVFSEHPIAMWALDDNLDFLSLLDSNDKQLSTATGYWAVTNASVSDPTSNINQPMVSESVKKITAEAETEYFDLTSRVLFNTADLDAEKGTFNISTYFRADTGSVSSILIGYTDGITTVVEPFSLPESYDTQWLFISKTFDLPEQDQDFRIVLRVDYASSEDPYEFYINGLSCGQWSEQHNMTTTGVIPDSMPESLSIGSGLSVVEASAYGLQSASGYYIASDSSLYASNSGVPMVFGASSVTKLYPHSNDDYPSLIVPGFGFLNDSGKGKSYTVEMWLRIDSRSYQPKRIFGPIESEDGLYVDSQYLTLKIGNSYRSHNIREWNRPMFVAIKYTEKNASLTINGEQVLDINLNAPVFPQRIVDGIEQDWLGFYAYSDIPVIEVDCVAIYSYLVPEVVLKRRFVYGQGVDFPENLNTGYNGKSIYVDYKFSNYSKNYTYPDIGRWKQGVLENIEVRNNHLETPVYPTPNFFIDYKRAIISQVEVTEDYIIYTSEHSFANGEQVSISGIEDYSFSGVTITDIGDGYFSIDNVNDLDTVAAAEVSGTARASIKQSQESLINDISLVQEESSFYLNLRPNSSWNNTYSYLTLENINLLKQPTEAIYAIFRAIDDTDNQTLIKIENRTSKDYIEISIVNGDTIKYAIKYGEASETQFYTESYTVGNLIQVGLNISQSSSSYGNAVRSFFGSKDALTLYVGGSPTLQNQFTGKIYKIGLSTKRNARKINDFFDENGILINVSSVFEDYFEDEILEEQIPFTYSGGLPNTVFVSDGELAYDGGSFDSFSYPRVYGHIASYTVLPNVYLGNFMLDVIVDSYWHDYVPLKYFGKFISDGESNKKYDLDYLQFNLDYPLIEKYAGEFYDTTLSNLRVYASFKYVSDRSNSDADFLQYQEAIPKSNVIIPDQNWSNTKYEIGNNTIVYIPKNIDFNKIVMHIHVEYLGSSTQIRNTKVNSLSIAGNALNKSKPTEIGTRFGFPITPTTKQGIYSDYRSRNPILISKSSKPYLYLDASSGIGLRPYANSFGTRSLRIKVNPDAQELYRIGAMQLATKYLYDRFPQNPEQIFEITSIAKTIKFYAVAANSSGTRGRIYALDNDSKLPYQNITFYINGKSVKDVYIDINSWSLLGFQFPVALDFDNDSFGEFAISGKIFINNVLFYQVSAEENAKTVIQRSWGQVRSMLQKEDDPLTVEVDESLDPTYWADFVSENEQWGEITSPVTWGTVLFIPTDRVIFIDPQKLFQAYLGTNKTIISDETELLIKNYEYRAYNTVSWSSSIVTPV